jgi:hypothetical protein
VKKLFAGTLILFFCILGSTNLLAEQIKMHEQPIKGNKQPSGSRWTDYTNQWFSDKDQQYDIICEGVVPLASFGILASAIAGAWWRMDKYGYISGDISLFFIGASAFVSVMLGTPFICMLRAHELDQEAKEQAKSAAAVSD